MEIKELIVEIEKCGSAVDIYGMKEEILKHLKDKKKKGVD